ncbi:2,3-diaminopropionate biosynthesis protein SbnB [Amycolatopsis sp. WAC 04169]|uniref:2,3-diaminopropionate biosynthesis protein SbnB n=1 Tax=Amycolatopsis sp. WAC 04169 TaxID=2203197 RepID=UPI000F77D69C|nr:2,3-diaminopropionate biosynthesis protein SbnB [Amycolatopsis sp. WAC 04169]RSN29146.1 2,3-diaminopropionate biosynthesis protein SbnB [Amycolatopsis sp. WAC 04169]
MSGVPLTQPRPFAVISGAQVRRVIHGAVPDVVEVIESAYRLHGDGQTVNPDSYFLRFPDRPSSRIIALPASVKGDVGVHGIKWIGSFPGNLTEGLPRASAVTILNDFETGYPFACLESSIISAARTAASAVLAVSALARRRGVRPTTVGFLGTGLIARYVHTFLVDSGFTFEQVEVHDHHPAYAHDFGTYLSRSHDKTVIRTHHRAASLIRASDLVVLATTAAEPYLTDRSWFDHNPLVLNISLRDLAPEIILTAHNVVDDVDHCLKAGTSPHLAEQRAGHRKFISGTLHDVLKGRGPIPTDRPVVFSPFGLGVLDLALARHVYDTIAERGELRVIDEFFADLSRYSL